MLDNTASKEELGYRENPELRSSGVPRVNREWVCDSLNRRDIPPWEIRDKKERNESNFGSDAWWSRERIHLRWASLIGFRNEGSPRRARLEDRNNATEPRAVLDMVTIVSSEEALASGAYPGSCLGGANRKNLDSAAMLDSRQRITTSCFIKSYISARNRLLLVILDLVLILEKFNTWYLSHSIQRRGNDIFPEIESLVLR